MHSISQADKYSRLSCPCLIDPMNGKFEWAPQVNKTANKPAEKSKIAQMLKVTISMEY